MTHSFDAHIAKACGVREAILLYNIDFWIAKNKANNKHFYKGHYWTYNSSRAFAELFPYLTQKVIENALTKLVKEGYLIKDNFNENSFDRTSWYSLTDKYYKIKGSAFTQIRKPIYSNEETEATKWENDYIDTDNKHTDNKQQIDTPTPKVFSSNELQTLESVPQASATQKVCEAQTQTEPKTEAELKPIDFEIPASLFEKQKKETPAEKYQNAMRQFLDFKQANPTCPISQEQWSEWLVACIKKNGSKFSYTAQTKSLKKSLTLNSAYVKEQIDKAIAGNWQGLNLNEAESKKYDRLEVYNANKPTSRQEQLEKGLSGIASYESKEPQEYLELVDSELNGAVPYDWLDFSYEIRIEKLRELKRQRLARERM